MVPRWWHSHRKVAFFCVVALLMLSYVCLNNSIQNDPYLEPEIMRRRGIKIVPELPSEILEPSLQMNRSIQKKMEEAVKLDKGTGCEIPKLNPFAKEATQFDVKLPPLKCSKKRDWVKCNHSACTVIEEGNVTCTFRDILYRNDFKFELGPVWQISSGDVYHLAESDFAQVFCNKSRENSTKVNITSPAYWTGNVFGFRPVRPGPSPPGRENTFNVVIFTFDSTARSGFIRRMPKSWEVLTKELNATIMKGYNIVGDGTSGALFPILTGKTELELPDVRKLKTNKRTMDDFPFIFYKLKQDGYRTAYYEDMPIRGTFQFRYNGFQHPLADHYSRALNLASYSFMTKSPFCLRDTPQFRVMMNITEQFLELNGKKFIFTHINDITHEDFNKIQWADDDTAAFLRRLVKRTEDTMIIIMGDHGPRYSKIRNANSIRGKLDERLPLMAIRLPSRLTRSRPQALSMLQANSGTLTTPHDLHATILDVLDMREHWNQYRMPGTELKRGLTMLEPIPRNRSCSEAGIEPHWCTCLVWQVVDRTDPLYEKSAKALLEFINALLAEATSICVPRTLKSIEWVLRQRVSKRLLTYAKSDSASYVGQFTQNTSMTLENYQLRCLELDGKKFIFTIIADISHDDFNKIQWADNDTAMFLRKLVTRTEDTLIIVMGDHGPKYSKIRNANSIRGKLDERLPLVAIRLPSRLMRERPEALTTLQANSRVLTTPHDLHATILDVLDMREHWNPYKLPGTELKRGLTMLEPIPRNRSCSEADIEPHWCTCLVWQVVPKSDPLYKKSAKALIEYINRMLVDAGPKCMPRKLKSIEWVLRQRVSKRLLTYAKSDNASYVGKFTQNTSMTVENYQLKIVSNPGRSIYEASLVYKAKTDKFIVHKTGISRTNTYKGESDCIIDYLPHLAAFCYCRRS